MEKAEAIFDQIVYSLLLADARVQLVSGYFRLIERKEMENFA